MNKTIRDVAGFLRELGGLHDARLLRLDWQCSDARLQLTLSDLCSNFEGLPEYRGCLEGSLVMEGVTSLVLRTEAGEGPRRIFDVAVERAEDAPLKLLWKIAPAGSIEVHCDKVVVHGDDLGRLPSDAGHLLSS
jgi:hypothetical protein